MLDVNDLVEGVTKVRILEVPRFVLLKVGDVGTFEVNTNHPTLPLQAVFEGESWWFNARHLEIVEETNMSVSNFNPDASSQSEDLIIYKSRWDEIIEGVNDACNMTEEEEEVVKSVLKNNIPFNIVPDLK